MSDNEFESQYHSSEVIDCNDRNYDEEFHDADLLFVPLGGTGEIGMNVNLYRYKGKWIMVDCGAGFADASMPGIDIIVADIAFIERHIDDLIAIVLTHAHEDHCGAIVHLWRKLRKPIYTTTFTANFLKKKLGSTAEKVSIHSIDDTNFLDLDPFKLEFVHLTHSIPEMNAVILHTDYGAVVHTGDWKIDENPVVGLASNEKRLKEISESEGGVISMVCDSTNVFSPGKSGSESDLHEPLEQIITNCSSAIAVTLFASNIARIETIAQVAKKLGKQMVILGRALDNVIHAAQESGYLTDYKFYAPADIQNIERNDLLVLCTGCQGDELAAVNKLSLSKHPYFELVEGDTIIFSSKIIPGNEKRIAGILNRFIKMDINTITEKTHKVHVSGHPYRGELQHMYEIVKPRTLIPVHGEHVHIHEHAKFAKECGIEHSLILMDGDVVRLAPGNIEKIGTVQNGIFCVDGSNLVDPEGRLMNTRRRLQNAGVVFVVLTVNSELKLIKKPALRSLGYTDNKKWEANAVNSIQKELSNSANIAREAIAATVVKAVKRSISRGDKIPHIEVYIEYATSGKNVKGRVNKANDSRYVVSSRDGRSRDENRGNKIVENEGNKIDDSENETVESNGNRKLF